MEKIAVLLTCYNRVKKTEECLERFFSQISGCKKKFDFYLVDDASPDQTGRIIKEKYPEINVIETTGNCYWCGGMRLAWKAAVKNADYDFFLWLNDDTLLLKDSLEKLFADYQIIVQNEGSPCLLSAACRNEKGDFSYGGRSKYSSPIFPNGAVQRCRFINGNLVLIPFKIYSVVGALDPVFTHSLGDYAYGLAVEKAGFSCWTTSEYLASCNRNAPANSLYMKLPIYKRLKFLNHPKGYNFKEQRYYTKVYLHGSIVKFYIKFFLLFFFPRIVLSLSRKFYRF